VQLEITLKTQEARELEVRILKERVQKVEPAAQALVSLQHQHVGLKQEMQDLISARDEAVGLLSKAKSSQAMKFNELKESHQRHIAALERKAADERAQHEVMKREYWKSFANGATTLPEASKNPDMRAEETKLGIETASTTQAADPLLKYSLKGLIGIASQIQVSSVPNPKSKQSWVNAIRAANAPNAKPSNGSEAAT